jgi:ferredoxin
MSEPGTRLRVNPVACSGHGVCAELLPELISLDEWGYPLLADIDVPSGLLRPARRAVTDCPALALALSGAAPAAGRSGRRGYSEDAQMRA